jgi:hypothetical protein
MDDPSVRVGVLGSVGDWVRAKLGVEDLVEVKMAAGVKDGTGCVERAAGEQATSIPTRANTTNICFATIVIITRAKRVYFYNISAFNDISSSL